MEAPKKILVVDDEKIITDILTRRFSRIGFEVVCANDGDDAIRLLNQNPVDVVICDVKIPKPRTAEDVLKVSRINNPGSKFVVMSGSLSSDSSVQSIMQAGASLFIKKPFNSLNAVTSEIIKILN